METENFGTVVFEGKVIILKQDPYLDGTHESPRFYASGVDQDGNDVKVRWDIKGDYLDDDGHITDSEYVEEADLCEWDAPSGIYVY